MLTVRCHSLVVLSFGHFSKRVPFIRLVIKHQRTAHSSEEFRGRCLHSCIAPSISALKLNCLCVLRSTFTVTRVTASWYFRQETSLNIKTCPAAGEIKVRHVHTVFSREPPITDVSRLTHTRNYRQEFLKNVPESGGQRKSKRGCVTGL